MKFGPVSLDKACGSILAHSISLEGGRLRKGKVLRPADIDRLREAGMSEITVARLDPGDVPEDAAAERLARALLPDPATAGLRLGRAATGRVNIHATGPGILGLDGEAINRLNRINPALTLATLAPFARLDDGALVATVKIINYAVPGEDVLSAEALSAQGLLRRHAPTCRTARLIETVIPGPPPSGKGRAATKGRLDRFGVALGPRELVPHQTEELAAALSHPGADIVLILTGSATSDENDVGPAALRKAGGEVIRVGMPVDPGNLLFVGRLQGVPVIGLPGCARSIALNGADWVLERLLCGIEVTGDDIASMGIGGLLKEPPSRPRPREAR